MRDIYWREVETFVHDLPGPPDRIDKTFAYCTNRACRFLRNLMEKAYHEGVADGASEERHAHKAGATDES